MTVFTRMLNVKTGVPPLFRWSDGQVNMCVGLWCPEGLSVCLKPYSTMGHFCIVADRCLSDSDGC